MKMKKFYDVAWHAHDDMPPTVQKSFNSYKEAYDEIKTTGDKSEKYQKYWKSQFFTIVKRIHFNIFKFRFIIQWNLLKIQPKNCK